MNDDSDRGPVVSWRGTWHFVQHENGYRNYRLTLCGRSVPLELVVMHSAQSVDPQSICKTCNGSC